MIDAQKIVEWKPIPGFPEYEVSNTGQVRSYKWKCRGPNAPVLLQPGANAQGYWTVVLRRNGQSYTKVIGRLVLAAFRGPCPSNHEMCHYDGNRKNDYLDNLRWDTHKANMADAVRHGTMKRRLTFELAEEIRAKYKVGNVSLRSLAKNYGVSHNTIFLIVKDKMWKSHHEMEKIIMVRTKQLSEAWSLQKITSIEFLDEMALTLMRASLKKVSS